MVKKLIVGLLSLSALLISGTFFYKKRSPSTPNVIWISLDTQRAKSLEIYGAQTETSPFLKNFAQDNIIFDKSYSQSSVTWTSHPSMLSGIYPVKHNFLNPVEALPLSKEVKMAAQYFKELGYETFMAGTFNDNDFFRLGFGMERGADYILPFDALRTPEQTIRAIKEALSFKKPFFAFLHTYIVHAPYALEQKYYDKYHSHYKSDADFFISMNTHKPEDLKEMNNTYHAAMNFQDHQLNLLFQELKKTIPNFDKTIIIITADHGESLGENDVKEHASYYQTNLWVPLIMKIPGYSKLRIKTPVRTIDILPTVLELVGGRPSENVDGKSMVYLLKHPETAKHYDVAYAQVFHRFIVFQDGWKYFNNGKSEELYNLNDDPDELKNLASTEPDKVFKMKSLLVNYQTMKLTP